MMARCRPLFCNIRVVNSAFSLVVLDRSRTTKENAEFTTRMLQKRGLQRAIIVTSWFHSRRALNSFLSFAPKIQFSSLPAYHQEVFAAEASHVLQEYIKTGWYFVH